MSAWESQLSSQEYKYFTQLFQFVSKQQEGIVTGAEAVRFFATSGVPNQILSEIWEAADRDKVGYLTPEAFSIALKLIACAQHGKEANANVLSTVVPLPQFDGAVAPSPLVSHTSTPLATPSTAGAAAAASTPITSAEREKYANIFKVHQPVNGVLDANTARNVFIKSKLSMETLSQIWYLADVRQSGSLNQTEFIIAMHYIAKLMDGTLSSLPDKLPPAVYQSAQSDLLTTATTQSPMMRNMSISSPSFHNARQQSIMTPPQRARTIDSLGNLAFGPSSAIHDPVQQWDVSAQEKQQFDAYFDKIDSNGAGAIQGKEAVEFFKNSRLPETDLAHIWDLADIQQRGALSRDEFAVAMHLIHKRLAGEQLPASLPKTLIPPSNTQQPPLQSPFGNSPAFASASPAVFAASPAPQKQTPQHSRSLIDDSNTNDLLGDFGNDQVSNETNQVNLMQNQISSLSTQTNDLVNKKQSTESVLEQLIKQKKDLEAQLTNVRMSHETAVKDLNEIQETVRREEGEWDQVRAEYDTAQQQLTALQNEIAQAQQTLENGRAETESLRRRVNEIQQETNAATAELEKMRAQTKQQSMMLDINRRQVTAAEQDRAQAKRHLEDYKTAGNLNAEEDDVSTENDTDEDESIFADSKQDPATANTDQPSVAMATSPEPTPSVVSTPALHNLFSESPAPKSATSPFASSASPFEAFSPAATTTHATGTTSSDDFDAIFGNMSSPTTSIATAPVNAFDSTAWATTATAGTPTTPSTAKSSRGPPPPPPQSRHHRQPSESVSSVNSATSPSTISKKQRAPPPPPPAMAAQQTPTQIQENSDEDDFEAAFLGNLPEAKVVTKENDDEDDFADFDDAFSAFDTKPNAASTQPQQQQQASTAVPASPTPASTSAATNDNWASSFGGFNFPGQETVSQKPASAAATTAANDDDWDSIFGSVATAPATAPATSNDQTSPSAPATTTTNTHNNGFDDAFSSFGDDFGKQSPVVTSSKGKQPANASSASPSPVTATKSPIHSIGIVGDKIEELVKMGFNEQEAKDALNRYDQDLEKASNFLLDQSSKS
ncbi:cytochrome c peroxidase [Mucor velutinosus]|uniref:Cytochrome c peroxidase n=1 Tax=Mucor velutinosus TaxID=708070 RepID=A0AAN7I3Q6_9FUNG|nr:cytochrome c peroxidase [Mucor velutinosus]